MKIKVKLKNNPYEIIIKRGILNHIQDDLNFNGKVMIVSDDNVAPLYLNTLKNQFENAFFHIIPHGEKSKNINSYLDIQLKLLEHSFTRNDLIIALGGGVVGDLVGFVASTFKRGIKYIQIPTSSLAQIDSSIGGKTAIDFQDYKNVIGTFYQPFKVYVDINVLNTLDKRHYYNGLVEALKMGLTFDKDLVDIFLKDDIDENLENIIIKAINIKRKVVEEDEKEENIRKVLNFGHTIGHGIESSMLNEILHGECVANGMLFFIENEKLKIEVKEILKKMNIPLLNKINVNKVIDYIKNDKKANNNSISIIKVKEIGNYIIENMTIDEIKELIIKEIKTWDQLSDNQ